LHVN